MVKKFDFSIALAISNLIRYLNLNKFLDLDLSKFRLFNLSKTSTISFLLFHIILYILLPISFFLTIFTKISKHFAYSIKVVFNIKVNSIVILLKA